MARQNAMEEAFELVEVCGKPALFTCLRIDRETVPKGLQVYEIRHADEDWGEPAQIARGILINHFGTVIMREKLRLPADGYMDIDAEKDFAFCDDYACNSVKAYMEKYPVKKKEERER